MGCQLRHGPRHLGAVPGSRILRTLFRRRQRRSQVRFACLAPATITDQANQHSYGRVVDVSVSGLGLVVAEEVTPGEHLQVEFALPGLDDQVLHLVATVTVQSARPVPSAGWRLGTTITYVGSSSRNNLVRYCYVVHPCERLRESRLGAEERRAAVIPMGPVPPAALARPRPEAAEL